MATLTYDYYPLQAATNDRLVAADAISDQAINNAILDTNLPACGKRTANLQWDFPVNTGNSDTTAVRLGAWLTGALQNDGGTKSVTTH
jgi:hypothetical protein